MFSREAVLEGLPARRASTLLFAIEGEAARLVAASRVTRAAYIGERTASEREQDFLQALRTGATLPNPPSIRDLERFAGRWAHLVPESADVRAELARMLGAKYRFRSGDVPRMTAALHLDDPMVAAALERHRGLPVASIFATSLPVAERLRWRLARVVRLFDRASPFWIAYFLALTEVLGEGMLSVPLALAGFGVVPGLLVIVGLGLVNLLTVGAMTESVVRNGSMRYGLAYLSRLITDLLGRRPAAAMGVIIAVDSFFTFWFYFLGFGSVLAGATGIPSGAWILLLFVVSVALLRKETLDDTIASAVLTGVMTMGLAILLTVWSILAIEPGNLEPPGATGDAGIPDIAAVGLVFGVLLMAFFGHASAANSAKLVLGLEPTGRALIGGNLAAMGTVVVLYAISTTAIIGAVGHAPLLATTGTAFTPLADVLGPGASVVAVAYTVLAIGFGSIWVTLGTYNQVVELLPQQRDSDGGRTGRLRGLLLRLGATRRGRLVVGFAPAAVVVLLLELAVVLGIDNFVGAVAFAGTLTVPVITGVLPLLLVSAARRTGEYVPGRVSAVLGHRLVVWPLIAAFVAGIAVHVLLWASPIERLAAAGFAMGAVLLVANAVRSRALEPRATVELRVDERERRTTLSVVADGRAIYGPIAVERGRAVTAQVPAGPWRRLRVWPHLVTGDGWSSTLEARATISDETGIRVVPIAAGSDPVTVTLPRGPVSVEVSLGRG